jgi:hypothetical protein
MVSLDAAFGEKKRKKSVDSSIAVRFFEFYADAA